MNETCEVRVGPLPPELTRWEPCGKPAPHKHGDGWMCDKHHEEALAIRRGEQWYEEMMAKPGAEGAFDIESGEPVKLKEESQ
jgi:hypothetical protein